MSSRLSETAGAPGTLTGGGRIESKGQYHRGDPVRQRQDFGGGLPGEAIKTCELPGFAAIK